MEIVNPLGSHIKKHKITIFYFTLANVPPQHRSKLSSIQLLAIGKTTDCRQENGDLKLLSDFITTINCMSTQGIRMDIHGDEHIIYGKLVIAACDTLASNWLGKFKEGVAFALRNCRNCDVENSQIKYKFVERQVQLRTLEIHRERCDALRSLTSQSKQYWSKIWGINGSSPLLDIDFDITTGLVMDPMHVLLEGVVPHELSQVLFHFVSVKKMFSIEWLNSELKSFEYSYIHKHAKPEPIDKKFFESSVKIKQCAAGMLTLIHVLPIIIGRKVPPDNQHWSNTLRLIQIVLFCTSTYCSFETVFNLECLIAEYLYNFKSELYPKASFTPKMHYLIHLPSQMRKFGPLRHHWCMRFEGKNGYFANKRYKNFKNLPRTLAFRHQLHMSYMQADSKGGFSSSFLYACDEIGTGEEADFAERHPDLSDKYLTISNERIVYITKSVTIHGIKYEKGCALVLDYDECENPTLAILEEVVIRGQHKYFVVHRVQSEYNPHILSYVFDEVNRKDIIPFSDLKFKWALSVYRYGRQNTVMNVNCHALPYPL
ncbi:hypothetical protein SNE40_021803 [Patella caerulea]